MRIVAWPTQLHRNSCLQRNNRFKLLYLTILNFRTLIVYTSLPCVVSNPHWLGMWFHCCCFCFVCSRCFLFWITALLWKCLWNIYFSAFLLWISLNCKGQRVSGWTFILNECLCWSSSFLISRRILTLLLHSHRSQGKTQVKVCFVFSTPIHWIGKFILIGCT